MATFHLCRICSPFFGQTPTLAASAGCQTRYAQEPAETGTSKTSRPPPASNALSSLTTSSGHQHRERPQLWCAKSRTRSFSTVLPLQSGLKSCAATATTSRQRQKTSSSITTWSGPRDQTAHLSRRTVKLTWIKRSSTTKQTPPIFLFFSCIPLHACASLIKFLLGAKSLNSILKFKISFFLLFSESASIALTNQAPLGDARPSQKDP